MNGTLKESPHTVQIISASQMKREAVYDLAQCSTEGNPFFEPFFLLPLLELDSSLSKQLFLSFYSSEGLLIGLIPYSRRHSLRGLFLPHAETLSHRHCFYRNPLIRAGHVEEVCALLLSWLEKQRFCLCFLFSRVDLNSQFVRALLKLSKRSKRAIHFLDIFERAIVNSPRPFQRYLSEALAKKQSKEARRKLRRARELGTVTLESLDDSSMLNQWCDDFIRLEHAGWKGRAGSAIGNSQREEKFFRAVCKGAASVDRLRMTRLLLNDKPIAIRCGFLVNETLFSFKTAYDERYAQCSPGYLLELLTIDHLARNESIQFVDSCADPSSELFERVFPDRKMIGTICVSNGPILGNTSVAALRVAHVLRQHLPGSHEEPRIAQFVNRLVSTN